MVAYWRVLHAFALRRARPRASFACVAALSEEAAEGTSGPQGAEGVAERVWEEGVPPPELDPPARAGPGPGVREGGIGLDPDLHSRHSFNKKHSILITILLLQEANSLRPMVLVMVTGCYSLGHRIGKE